MTTYILSGSAEGIFNSLKEVQTFIASKFSAAPTVYDLGASIGHKFSIADGQEVFLINKVEEAPTLLEREVLCKQAVKSMELINLTMQARSFLQGCGWVFSVKNNERVWNHKDRPGFKDTQTWEAIQVTENYKMHL